MIIFGVPLADPRDPGGWGVWLNAHYLEHQQFVQIIQAQGTATASYNLPLVDIGLWRQDSAGMDQWMSDHFNMTAAVTDHTGMGNPDFGETDWSNPMSYLVWLDNHATWHAQQRAALGIK